MIVVRGSVRWDVLTSGREVKLCFRMLDEREESCGTSFSITWFPTERPTPPSGHPNQLFSIICLLFTMPPQRNAQRTYNEGTLSLAIQATQDTVPDSIRHASKAFGVPRTTLRRRRAGQRSRAETEPNSKRLTALEEEEIVRRILELDARRIGATRTMVEEMANDLRAARGKGPVGKNWVDRFKARTSEIKLRCSRPYDRQRALNEYSRVITPWFKLVEDTKAQYGILDEDTYNVDETGFMMGMIRGQMVLTATEKRSNSKRIQPCSREWVTFI